MRGLKFLSLAGVVIVVSGFLFACASSKKAATTPHSGSPTAQSSAAASPSPKGDAQAIKGIQSAANQFAALPKFDVVYDINLHNPGSGSFTATLTMQHNGSKSRSDFSGNVNGKKTDLTTITDGSNMIICTAEPKGECVQGDASQLASSDPLGSLNAVEILRSVASDSSATIKSAKSQKIAGIEAQCYAVAETNQQSTFCVDQKTGTLLLADGKTLPAGENQSTERIEATSASASAGTIDTKAPYPIVTPSPTSPTPSATKTATPTPKP